MKSVTILVSDIADLAGIRVRPVRRTPARRESLHGRLVLAAGQPAFRAAGQGCRRPASAGAVPR